jgi:hypothetical protein
MNVSQLRLALVLEDGKLLLQFLVARAHLGTQLFDLLLNRQPLLLKLLNKACVCILAGRFHVLINDSCFSLQLLYLLYLRSNTLIAFQIGANPAGNEIENIALTQVKP